ncbi:mechanosensitive ion channel family protein [Neobacillus mesonae]|uniref:mechanosensitive ion channel family protein n=1 Tax=Neobacillus mesonae TaxID=1193713 RepID=UPI00203DD7F3|nr:mechanosensitive ion channel family protein [Neobacillus mesonae]MCM3570728.1 mechanosensitive ion channel family protein [Neobacillus mesonae]
MDITTEKGFKKNIIDKFKDEDTWMSLGEGVLKILIILLIANIIIRIGKVAIHNIFKLRNLSPLNKSGRREETLAKLLDNTLTYVVYFIAIMMVLSVLGIDVKALIAGAGVVGLAVGFGAQSLVKDIISGFFIIFEDQFSVGDYIRIEGIEGTVEAIGLRTTIIKSWTGEVHILPNGSISRVTNFSLNNSVAVVDIAISYGEDIENAQRVIEEAIQMMPGHYKGMIGVPSLLGVQTMGPTEVVLRVTAETQPMEHWGIARAMRKDIKVVLEQNGIKVPVPKYVMYSEGEM